MLLKRAEDSMREKMASPKEASRDKDKDKEIERLKMEISSLQTTLADYEKMSGERRKKMV